MDLPKEREDQIVAYLNGELTPEETVAFERRIETDGALCRQVEQWREALEAARDWMRSDAPGVERVADLAIPSVASKPRADAAKRSIFSRKEPVRPFSFRSLAWAGLAAAAIFFAGFSLGQMAQRPTGLSPGSGATGAAVQQTTKPTPTPSEQQHPDRGQIELAGVPAQRYTDEQGRLVVETTLQGSGARALWVVDGKFQLAQFSENR